ncbi:MAG: ABC transporter permease subunit, partial [Parvibaculaceae bacterium]
MRSRLGQLLPWPAWPFALYLLVLLVAPLAALLLTSFWSSEFFQISRDFTLKNYAQIFHRPLYLDLILKSFWIGLLVAMVTVPVSFLAAHALTFRFQRWSGLLLGLFMASMLSSYLIRIYAWKAILGPGGVINLALIGTGVIEQPLSFLLYGNFAIVVTLVHIQLPFAVLPIYAALQNIDPQVVEASRDLGAGPVETLFRVLVPLAMPGISAAFLICFILSAADYVTPQLVGGADGVMIGRVIADQFGVSGNMPLGAALAIVLLLSFVLVLGAAWLLRAAGRRLLAMAARRSRARRKSMRSGLLRRLPIHELGLPLIFLFLYAPLLVVFLFSFNTSTSGIFPMRGLTTEWYAALFRDAMFRVSLKASLLVGVTAVAGCLLIGTPAAFMMARRKFAARRALLALGTLPLAMPGVVIGVAFLAALGVLGIRGGLAVTAIAHTLVCLPFLVMVLGARLRDFDRQVEEAGRDLGSSPARVLRTITLPFLAPTLAG